MNFNFNTPNLVVFQFPRYAGGKFVINCLGLSDNMVLQSQSLAQRQIDRTISLEDKKEYIIEHLSWEDAADGWADLRLGDTELFVSDENTQGDSGSAMQSLSYGKQHDGINDTVKFLSQQEDRNLLFPIISHSATFNRERYPNAKVIQWKNNDDYVRTRTSLLRDNQMPRDEEQWNNVANEISDEFKEKFGEKRTFILQKEADFLWDTNWFNSTEETLDGVHSLYNFLNLTDWDKVKEFVEEYYNSWIIAAVTPRHTIVNGEKLKLKEDNENGIHFIPKEEYENRK